MDKSVNLVKLKVPKTYPVGLLRRGKCCQIVSYGERKSLGNPFLLVVEPGKPVAVRVVG